VLRAGSLSLAKAYLVSRALCARSWSFTLPTSTPPPAASSL